MKDYQKLLDYYKKCFSLVDCFHYNSDTSKEVFMQYLPTSKGQVVSITHGGIEDHRIRKVYGHDVLHIGFIGNSTPYKGLPLLISVLQVIGMIESWDLSVWGGGVGKHPSLPIYYKGKFDSSTIADVYSAMDVLIVPSIWKETFSLVTLEALSYGVPVIVSDNVGAQDIVKLYNPKFVYHSEDELKSLICEILSDRNLLAEFNDKLLSSKWKYSMEEHAKEIIDKIYKQ
ncbi:Glycosyl transferases group 1 [Segatella bryantii]|uniref:glycosyltransferase n=1 Tax=Segatella bryantii TaxID=77095 RepID=UPI0008948EF1|nr:glycosyltransferase [Segatella bryantii]SEA57574.1 Glycosyl transferases group 1 [Segatella bryantii]